MSKRGKQKKAENVEKRRRQMEEALECLVIKQTLERQLAIAFKRKPKQCTFSYCRRFVDPSCTVCPYCGNPLQSGEPLAIDSLQKLALQGC
jgi:hypothetical protein